MAEGKGAVRRVGRWREYLRASVRACERKRAAGRGVQAAHGQRLPASVSLRDVADCLVALHGGTPPPRHSRLPDPAAGSVKGTGGSGGEGGGNLLAVLHSLG